jgi:hypothetical protein
MVIKKIRVPDRLGQAVVGNVGDGVKECANGGTTACTETARLVARQVA